MNNKELLLMLFSSDLKPKTIHQMRQLSGFKQKEFDESVKHLCTIGLIMITRYDYDEVGDQVPYEYGLTEEGFRE